VGGGRKLLCLPAQLVGAVTFGRHGDGRHGRYADQGEV
jgi:hypothetical protein